MPVQTNDLKLTPDEVTYLKNIVCAWIEEGFTRPPYDHEVYSLIHKLGITQDDIEQYNITPPPGPI